VTPTDQILRDEGYRQFPYKDSVGILTIAIGRNLESDGISKDEALYMLNNDIAKRTAALRQALPIFDHLSECRQGVLVNMSFMGVTKLLRFKKMIAALENHDYNEAAAEMADSKWAVQVKDRAKRLQQQMITDQWV